LGIDSVERVKQLKGEDRVVNSVDEYKSKHIIGSEFAKRIDFLEKKNDISTTKILNHKNK